MQDVKRALAEQAHAVSVQGEAQDRQGREELLGALKKAVRALRDQDDERSAATLSHFAEELARQPKQGARWTDNAPVEGRKWKQSENDGQPGPNGWERTKKEPVRNEPDRRGVGWQAPENQDRRVDELAEQVAKLSKMVEKLAGRLEESEKQKRVSR